MPNIPLNLAGKTFGRLTCIKVCGSGPYGRVWECQCACGEIIKVPGRAIKKGNTKSCGCLKIDLLKKRTITHGMSKTATYRIWFAMIRRCTEPSFKKYELYGGKGITVCDRWLQSFENFLKDMGPRPSSKHSLDRYPDQDGNYEPENVRWATQKEQCRNNSRNVHIEFNGKSQILIKWSEELGISYGVLHSRLSRGWGVERAFTTKVKK